MMKQLEQRLLFSACDKGGCRHGLKDLDLFSRKSTCIKFLKTFTNAMLEGRPIVDIIQLTHDLYPGIWTGHDAEGSKAIKSWFVYSGANFLLNSDKDSHSHHEASIMAVCLLWLEHYDPLQGFDEDNFGPSGDQKYLTSVDIWHGCQRSIVKFFKRRVPCSCLDKMRAAATSIPKTGLCDDCEERKERRELSFCTCCKRRQYCSQECQVKDWQDHKALCNKYSV